MSVIGEKNETSILYSVLKYLTSMMDALSKVSRAKGKKVSQTEKH